MNIITKRNHRNGSWKDRHNKTLDKKKQTVIVDHDDRNATKVVRTKAGDVRFDNGIAVMENDGRAQEAYEMLSKEARHPHQYAMVRDREGMKRSRTHPMRISGIALPWHKYDKLGRIIREE